MRVCRTLHSLRTEATRNANFSETGFGTDFLLAGESAAEKKVFSSLLKFLRRFFASSQVRK